MSDRAAPPDLLDGCHATFVANDPPRDSCLALWTAPVDGVEAHATMTPIELVLPSDDGPRRTVLSARVVPVAQVLDDLAVVAVDDARVSPSVAAWGVVARTALAGIARGRLQPAISEAGHDSWAVTPLDEGDRALRAALVEWLPPAAHCLHEERADGVAGPVRMTAAHQAVSGFVAAIADSLPRTAAAGTVSRQPAWSDRRPVDVTSLRAHVQRDDQARVVVGLRVSPPVDEDQPFVVELQVRSADDPTTVADAKDLWAGTAEGFDHDAEAELLIALRRGSRLWPPLDRLLEDSRPSRLEIDDDEAMELLRSVATDLGGAGIEVLVPAELTRKVRATAHAGPPSGSGDRSSSSFDLATTCELTWRATLDGEPISEAELAAMAASRRPLVRLRGNWVVVDPSVSEQLGRREQLSGADTLAAALSGTVTIDGATVEATVSGAPAVLAARLRAASRPHELDEPPGLEATLRPYQRRGLGWLTEMTNLGLGGVLADDMGLGKTIQLIALHLQRAGHTTGPTLVVCPATLVRNWELELERFAPSVRVHRYHGADRSLAAVDPGDVVITTYGIVRRDIAALESGDWGIVAADEAQQVKNPSSATAKALRRVPSSVRFALTGTPLENRLTDLWALLDWTSPGLLGSIESFRRSIAVPIERDRDQATTERFGHLISPFLLRRRKDDPDIVPDLPPKTETDHPVVLSAEQAGLYQATVDDILEAIASAEGIARRGLVLKLLTSLKQICNHPAHFLGQTGPLSGRSGKLDLFDELIGSITDAGDSTLVFTQYVAMGHLLERRLAELGISSLFLHGSTPLATRAAMVEQFQAGRAEVFVLSLKAGGTGLNLTRATHVIHYDRWWNPAVENQASDRAWRIGQDRPVQIHRMISDGTIEARIAQLLEQKKALAESVVGGGETWLTELDDDELAELVRLGSEVR